MDRTEILEAISIERDRQNKMWGFPQNLTPMEWGSILSEEVGELCTELNALNKYHRTWYTMKEMIDLKKEAIHVAAVAVSIIEHLYRTDKMIQAIESLDDVTEQLKK